MKQKSCIHLQEEIKRKNKMAKNQRSKMLIYFNEIFHFQVEKFSPGRSQFSYSQFR